MARMLYRLSIIDTATTAIMTKSAVVKMGEDDSDTGGSATTNRVVSAQLKVTK